MLRQSLLVTLAFVTLVAANYPFPIRRVEDRLVDTFQDQPNVNYRLPNNTRPISYDLRLTTHVHTQTDFSFTGEVAVRFSAIESSNTISLHQRQLTIGASSLHLANSIASIPLNPVEYDSETEILTFTLTSGSLSVNSEYILTINYNGTLRTDEAGFYRSSYVDDDGTRRWLATTQFESTDARHGFPCYDEGAFRALLSLSITHGTSYRALSNMPVAKLENSSLTGYTTTIFEVTTAPTPPYLFAFIVSDFPYTERKNDRDFVQRVFARPNAIQHGGFALETGVKSLNAFEAYFGINFTFPKMDQVAIPDFSSGAMENWGLVTYREQYLLFDETKSTFVDLRNIATVIAHEYAHQWFGNRVTARWWSYLWLNEGFADLFESYATDWVFPEWKILDTLVFSKVQNAMISDATTATRPMTYYVESPRAVSALFDNVAYAKSGCVLRMFLNAFTENSFKKGLFAYLNTHSNSAATEDDLFVELEKAVKSDGTLHSSLNVPTIFSSWTRQAGFPLVTVERNYETGTIVLSQERYLSENQTTPSTSRWWIPINYASASVHEFEWTNATSWFGSTTETINDESILATDWFLLNKRQTGYYRVKYDLQNYKLLAEQLQKDFGVIHLASRSQLIDDAFDFASTERLGYDVAFDLIKYLEHEVEYVPWASTFRGLTLVDRLYAGSEGYVKFTAFIQKQLAHLYSEARLLAAAGEHHYRKQARNQAIQWSCRFKSKNCLDETNLAFDNYLSRNVAIHQDHRSVILCSGVRSANEIQFTGILSKLEAETDATDRLRLLDAIACTTNIEWAKLILNMTISESSVHFKSESDRIRVFSAIVADSQHGTELAYDFLRANIDVVFTRYGRGNTNTAIARLASQTVNAERTNQFEALAAVAAAKDFIDANTITNARNTLAANKRWTERNAQTIEEWLEKNSSAQIVGSLALMAVLLFITQMF